MWSVTDFYEGFDSSQILNGASCFISSPYPQRAFGSFSLAVYMCAYIHIYIYIYIYILSVYKSWLIICLTNIVVSSCMAELYCSHGVMLLDRLRRKQNKVVCITGTTCLGQAAVNKCTFVWYVVVKCSTGYCINELNSI